MSTCCPTCGQPMPITRAGVRLSPLKARIFDIVKRAGTDGFPTRELVGMLWEGKSMTNLQQHVIYCHVHQINDALEDTGLRIVGIGRGHRGGGRLRLVKA